MTAEILPIFQKVTLRCHDYSQGVPAGWTGMVIRTASFGEALEHTVYDVEFRRVPKTIVLRVLREEIETEEGA